MRGKSKYAGIQYLGFSGATIDCIRAIIRILHFGDKIVKAYILTSENRHGFLLKVNENEDLFGIKCGFSSGYPGTGPWGLALTLEILNHNGAEISEHVVPESLLDRLDDSRLLVSDIDLIEVSDPITPPTWYEYILNQSIPGGWEYHAKRHYPTTLPTTIIDKRLSDLEREFTKNPDSAIMSGYKRLESIVRTRADLKYEVGAKLFSKAFINSDSPLVWPDIDPGESKGRASLFSAVFLAYRNRRAHNERKYSTRENYREFMLLNELFLLEAEAKERQFDTGQEDREEIL